MIQLTKMEEALIFGAILGDSHIRKRNSSYNISFAHAIRNKDYLLWKAEKLKRLTIPNFELHYNSSKSSDGLYYFNLAANSCYKFYHDLIYKSYQKDNKICYRKTITLELIEYMPAHPLLLVVWFLDDGSIRNNSFSGKLSTQCFTYEEHKLLQKFLIESFSITTNINISNRIKNQYYLGIPRKSFEKLTCLIKPYVNEIPTMQYKIKNPLL